MQQGIDGDSNGEIDVRMGGMVRMVSKKMGPQRGMYYLIMA